MSKITFGYIVGGEDKHYNNLLRSLESLERIEQPHEVVILDADSRLEADEDKPNVRIIPFPVDEAKGEGWFKPHYWQMRYHLNKYVETDHCFNIFVKVISHLPVVWFKPSFTFLLINRKRNDANIWFIFIGFKTTISIKNHHFIWLFDTF